MQTSRKALTAALLIIAFCLPGSGQSSYSQKDLAMQSWKILSQGLENNDAGHRAAAIRVFSLLSDEARAVRTVTGALGDTNSEVRAAAAMALGNLHATSTIPKLRKMLNDEDISVVLAAAHSLIMLHDKRAYGVYYAILMRDQKSSEGLISSQLERLRDPKKMAVLGVEEGIGFVPFASLGYTAIKTVMKDDSSPVRAAAAKVLADDPDSVTEDALIQASITDKSELVRTAALEAIAKRGNPAIVPRLAPALQDDKGSVRYTAAAVILHLSDIAKRPRHPKQ
jgi:HEAT repeat protein